MRGLYSIDIGNDILHEYIYDCICIYIVIYVYNSRDMCVCVCVRVGYHYQCMLGTKSTRGCLYIHIYIAIPVGPV